jgi:hypothetical protein
MDGYSMGHRARSSYALKHRPMGVAGFDCIEDHRYALLLSNGGLVLMDLVATMTRIFEAIRIANLCTKPQPASSS